MNVLRTLSSNYILIASITGWLVAQILKTLIHMHFTKTFVKERLIGSGGMPSSHSSTVCALATATGIQFGLDSYPFAISTIFAIIVMYDAMGVRMETGKQAKVLNELMELFTHATLKIDREKKLKEFVGHTPLQVLAGAVLGILIAILLGLV